MKNIMLTYSDRERIKDYLVVFKRKLWGRDGAWIVFEVQDLDTIINEIALCIEAKKGL